MPHIIGYASQNILIRFLAVYLHDRHAYYSWKGCAWRAPWCCPWGRGLPSSTAARRRCDSFASVTPGESPCSVEKGKKRWRRGIKSTSAKAKCLTLCLRLRQITRNPCLSHAHVPVSPGSSCWLLQLVAIVVIVVQANQPRISRIRSGVAGTSMPW